MPQRQKTSWAPTVYTTALIYIAINVAILSFLSSYYNFGVFNATSWVGNVLDEYEYTHEKLEWLRELWDDARDKMRLPERRAEEMKAVEAEVPLADGRQVLTNEQLALFDGTRDSRPIYLAILGRVYDVERGKKHYGKNGGYHFFAGKDATRAFVTGDFSEAGLTDDTEGLSAEDMLGIRDWLSFYEKDYTLVGVVTGRYYDSKGKPTEELQRVLARIEQANEFRKMKTAETEVFPPCNSEWHHQRGGRVWCSTKSGGVQRDWAGVPRILLDPKSKQKRCACVKNFGSGLSGVEAVQKSTNRGDLDHPHLRVYPNCSPQSNSCKLEDD